MSPVRSNSLSIPWSKESQQKWILLSTVADCCEGSKHEVKADKLSSNPNHIEWRHIELISEQKKLLVKTHIRIRKILCSVHKWSDISYVSADLNAANTYSLIDPPWTVKCKNIVWTGCRLLFDAKKCAGEEVDAPADKEINIDRTSLAICGEEGAHHCDEKQAPNFEHRRPKVENGVVLKHPNRQLGFFEHAQH